MDRLGVEPAGIGEGCLLHVAVRHQSEVAPARAVLAHAAA